jgi:hypothetical protein
MLNSLPNLALPKSFGFISDAFLLLLLYLVW